MKTIIQIFAPILLAGALTLSSCKKEIAPNTVSEESLVSGKSTNTHGHLTQTKTFSSAVVGSWLNMQLDMLRTPLPAGTGSQNAERCQAYCGIALYEAVVPGMPAYRTLEGQLTNFPDMPETSPGLAYHWAASANAALAEMNRRLFPTTAQANKTSMDALENSLNAIYATEVNAATLQRSIAFGKEVATRVANWAATDGSANVNPPYVPPVGPGLWVPTSPTPAIGPYTFQRRYLVPGVTEGTALAPLPAFSTVPGSPFHSMVKELYDHSLALTPDQVAMAYYFRDAPGYPGGGHFISLLAQVFNMAQPKLDIAALAYARVGISQYDATVLLFTNKYTFNVMRPVTYIRDVMGHTSWNTQIPTPNHPEFPSGHATTNSAVMEMLINTFGDNFPMTLHTYDYQNLPPRSYNSFTEMGREMADSRFHGGLHYMETCNKSLVQGKKVGQNVLAKIQFLK